MRNQLLAMTRIPNSSMSRLSISARMSDLLKALTWSWSSNRKAASRMPSWGTRLDAATAEEM